MNPVTIISTWAKALAKNIESWVRRKQHAQIEQRGAADNTAHRLYLMKRKVKIKVGKIEAEGNCFNCNKYSALVLFGSCWICPTCYAEVNPQSPIPSNLLE